MTKAGFWKLRPADLRRIAAQRASPNESVKCARPLSAAKQTSCISGPLPRCASNRRTALQQLIAPMGTCDAEPPRAAPHADFQQQRLQPLPPVFAQPAIRQPPRSPHQRRTGIASEALRDRTLANGPGRSESYRIRWGNRSPRSSYACCACACSISCKWLIAQSYIHRCERGLG